MYKLVIVEDEDHIRQSLERLIPWQELGFQVADTFADGSDALAYLTENPCDVVLTDILMSRMSGLELTQRLHEIHPQVKIVILSGHSDFAYAQQAIRYNVVRYLVKPLDEDELMDVFKGIKTQLDEQQEDLLMAESETRDLKQLLQKSFFRDLLSGRVTSENELNAYLRLLGAETLHKEAPLLAYELEARQVAEPFVEADASAMLAQWLDADQDAYQIFLQEEDNEHWRIIFVGAPACPSSTLRKSCNARIQQLLSVLNSSEADAYSCNLTHSVAQLTELLSASAAMEGDSLLQSRQVDGTLCKEVVADYKLLIMELDLGDKQTLIHILTELMYSFGETPVKDIQFVLKNLYSLVELEYKKRKINTWEITGGKFNFNHLYRYEDIKGIAACLKEDFCSLSEALKYKKCVSNHSVVERLVQYLDAHLNEDVSHEAIAAKYRLHPGYLSRLFKQEMGETLSDYLLRIRIEKAASLLKEGRHKVGDIAGMVGYSASSYFSIMFKKYTGYSPREYSQRISL